MKKSLSLFMALIFALLIAVPTSAMDNGATSEVIVNDDGSYLVIQYEPVVVSLYDKDNTLLERSSVNEETGIITSVKYDGMARKAAETTYDINELVTKTNGSDLGPVVSSEPVLPTEVAPLASSSEPYLSNSGLTPSSLYPGWYIIGTYSNSVYPGYTATVHRKFSGSKYASGQAYRVQINAGMGVSAIVSLLTTLPLGLPNAALSAIGNFLVTLAYETFSATVTYHSFHYLYQVSVNNKSTPQHKYCASHDFWYCEAQGKSMYEYKGSTANHFNGAAHFDQAQTAINDFASGASPTGGFCGI